MYKFLRQFYCLITIFIALHHENATAQTETRFHEKFEIITDRDNYIAGENINLSIFRILNQSEIQSKVIYLSLHDSSGRDIVNRKTKIIANQSFTKIEIPQNTSSGAYTLFAYTKWQKNFNQEHFAIKHINILNHKKNISNKLELTFQEQTYPQNNFLLTSNKEQYIPREKINVDFEINKKISSLCVSVTKQNQKKKEEVNQIAKLLQKQKLYDKEDFYLPEIHSHYISGKIINKESKKPIANSELIFTILDSLNTTKIIKTDANGNFIVLLPSIFGKKEIAVQMLKPGNDYTILIDSDFKEKLVGAIPTQKIQKHEQEYFLRLLINHQITQQFKGDEAFEKNKVSTNYLFYGKPASTYSLKKYIDLPTIEEVFTNIVLEALFQKKGGNYSFYMTDKNDMPLNFAPLVLMDGIPVTDIAELENISPKKLDRIEIINTNYLIGNTVFGGIINFFSKHKDYAGLKFPKDMKTIIHEFPEKPIYEEHLIHVDTLPEKHRPVFRNTVYWNPQLKTDKEGKGSFEFITTDETGTFLIKVCGFSEDGLYYEGTKTYEVKKELP